MSKISKALKKADSDRSQFLFSKPNFGIMSKPGSKKKRSGVNLGLLLGVCAALVLTAWLVFDNGAELGDKVLVGNKDLIFSGGRSNIPVSSVDEDFNKDGFQERLEQDYIENIEPVEEIVQERASSKSPGQDEAGSQVKMKAKAEDVLIDKERRKVLDTKVDVIPGDLKVMKVKVIEKIEIKTPLAAAGDPEAKKVIKTYIVRPGDNLSRIAGYDFIYGDPDQWKKIYEKNKDRLGAPDKIRVGQELIIPEFN